MEEHHVNHATNILNTPGMNIFLEYSIGRKDSKTVTEDWKCYYCDWFVFFCEQGKDQFNLKTEHFSKKDTAPQGIIEGNPALTCSDLSLQILEILSRGCRSCVSFWSWSLITKTY
jgi:hypothetical protein